MTHRRANLPCGCCADNKVHLQHHALSLDSRTDRTGRKEGGEKGGEGGETV